MLMLRTPVDWPIIAEVRWGIVLMHVSLSAVQILTNDDPDAIFVYYGNTDILGHSYGTLAPQTISFDHTVARTPQNDTKMNSKRVPK